MAKIQIKTHQCPACGSWEVVPIVYGLPAPGVREDADAGKHLLGGCLVEPDSPTRVCKDCGHEWGRLGPGYR